MCFVACTESNIDIQNANDDVSNDIIDSEQLAITVGFEEDETRIALDETLKTVWQKGDLVSVFYIDKTKYQWQFQGETGDRSGVIMPVGEVPSTTKTIVVLYPDRDDYTYSGNSVLANVDATQSYAANSYGNGGNILVATQVGTSANNMMLRSVYGWLKLQLTGDSQSVKSIRIKGNNNEQVAGSVSFNIYTAANAQLIADGNGATELTLDCGDGVALSRTQPTAFYIGFVPQTFEGGITVEIENTQGHVMTKSTTKSVAIARNTIQPMSAFVFAPEIPEPEEIEAMYPGNDQIWYNVSNGVSHNFSVAQPFDVSYTANQFGDACANGTCYNFYAITFEDEVTAVNALAFKDSSLTEVYLPHSVTTIGNGAFFGSTKLKEVHLGANIESINYMAFTNCYNLQALYIRATTPPTLDSQALIQDSSGSYAYIGCTIYVPASAVDTYKNHPDWAKYADYIRAYDFIAGEEPGGGGSIGDDDTRSDFNHRLLIVDHTGINCGNCPTATNCLHAIAETEMKDYYNEVQIHGGGYAPSGSDPGYSEAATIVDKFYAPTGYPYIYANYYGGRLQHTSDTDTFVNSTATAFFNSHRKKLGADAGIAINSTLENSTIRVNINVKSAKAQEYNVAVWILENNIYSPNQNGATTELHKTYQHVLRYIATDYTRYDISGNWIGELGVGDVGEVSYTVPLNSSWVTSNLEVLVIVSAPNADGNFEVVNTAVCPANGTKNYEYISDLENGGNNGGDNTGGGDDTDDPIVDGGDDSDAIILTDFIKGSHNTSYGYVQYTVANDDNYVIQLYVNEGAHELTVQNYTYIVGDLKNCSLNYVSSKSNAGNSGMFCAEVRCNGSKKTISDGTLIYLNKKLTLSFNYSDGTSENFVYQAN